MPRLPRSPRRLLITLSRELRIAKSLYGSLPPPTTELLRDLLETTNLSIAKRQVICIGQSCYVTHSGLLSLAKRRRCSGIHSQQVQECCDPSIPRWVFKATVYRSRTCKGFVGYGDADPTNVSPAMHGSELRIAETRAVNRALRKAYGIGICSVEELGSSPNIANSDPPSKFPARPVNSNGSKAHPAPRVRDRLCQIIRSHSLDAELVKSYAVSFCGTKTLREARREQVEAFVTHLADWVEKDRNALLCQLNSFQRPQAGAA
jgi:hypothetical protein